jgi:hypothetical protein
LQVQNAEPNDDGMSYTTITALWQAFIGAPGYTKLKFQGALDSTASVSAANLVRQFFFELRTVIPAGITVQVQGTAQTFDDNGTLTGEVAISPVPAVVTGSGAGDYAGGVGAVIFWNTNAVHAGGKVRGRTYIVPMNGAAFDTNGSLDATAQGVLQAAANNLVAGNPDLAVNSRKPPDGSGSNATVSVFSATVPDRPAVLRSRRD